MATLIRDGYPLYSAHFHYYEEDFMGEDDGD